MGNWPLNPAQNEAVNCFDADILVSAGAGTGKTRVLTQKYLRLLEERRATVPEIVAITFTKKAALEMRERIDSGLRELLDQAQSADAEYWQQQLAWLENARITTFHSFCLGLIREYPLEAGVGPVDKIFGAAEETIYLQQAGEAAIYETMREPGSPAAVLTRILTDFGWDTVLTDLSSAYRQIRETGTSLVVVTEKTNVSLKMAIEKCPFQIHHLIDCVAELLHNYPTLKLTERAQNVFGGLLETWPSLRSSLEAEDKLNEVIPALITLGKALPRNLPKVVKEQVEEIHDIAQALTQLYLDQEAQERLPVYGKLLEQLDHYYSTLKREQGALDFADQIIIARNLLRDYPLVAAELQNCIRYLLVDEFQDTNPLQMELISLLTKTQKDRVSEGRFMAVGDIKQSIYRFRGADASIIHTMAESFRAGAGRVIALRENYRSAALILQFINELATPLFAGEMFIYESLIPGDSVQTAEIELLWTGSMDRHEEAAAIAGRIQEIIRNPAFPEQQLNYSDIVILFRATTAMTVYQQALQNAGIPFYTASGGSFFQCQEVLDQLNLLRLVEQGFDGVALYGLLSSPFVGLSHENLLWLSKNGNLTDTFYEGLWPDEVQSKFSTSALERLDNFRRLVLHLRRHRGLMRIPDILRTGLQQTSYQAVLWTMPDATQKVANLEKLLAKAEEFCAQGFYDLASFLVYIKQLEEEEVLEGEAPTQAEAGNAVRLMTIHRAKGLEFRVVFLADLDRSFRYGNQAGLTFHKQIGLGFPVKFGNRETGRPTILEQLRELERDEEIAELKRVLYVALTRAKQQLILVGSGKSRFKGNTFETAGNWMKWFEILLGLQGEETVVDFHGIRLPVRKRWNQSQQPDKLYRFLDEVIDSWSADHHGLPETPPTGEIQAAVTLEVVRNQPVRLNVSELLSFKRCPRQYFWQHRMKLDQAPGNEQPGAGSRSSVVSGSMIGNFFHQAIRNTAPEWPEALWRQTFSQLSDGQDPILKNELELIWRNFQLSGFARTPSHPVDERQYWDETPFLLAIDSEVRVEGRWDRLIGFPDGRLHLVDFKTHRSNGAALLQLAASYEWQLQLYALAVEQIWDRLPDRASLYFPFADQTVDVALDPDAVAETIQEVRRIGQFIAIHDDWRKYPMARDCRYCGYQLLCGVNALPGEAVST